MAFLRSPEKLGQGSIVVVDSKTLKTTQLRLENFSGTFTTHGIDIYTPSSDPDSVYIFAVNHLPNPAYWSPPPRTNASALEPKARSQIEIFRHELGSDSATHIRSVWDPLVRTPNDILAISETEFYFTNDHYYREGTLRLVEDVGFDLTPWTDIIHVKLSGLESVKSSSEGVTASVAFKHQNTNGIGHGASDDEVLVGRAAAGVMVRTKRKAGSSELKSLESIQLDSTIDNPSYFRDRYAKETGRDASGYVLGGLLEAVKYPKEDGKDPVVVWLVQKSAGTEGKAVDDGWNKTAIFQDDGSVISSASTAVLAPIDPKENDGRKQGWLFVSGPTSKATVAARVDL
ncbi:MAG: hypothetical protein M1820_007903 [Bogoriella megaspora]|nr:MAG: hypothetical protein M1820_007903 [Bogoriella megaspora]